MKKIISTFLAALLCLSLAAPAAMAYGPWDGRTAVSSNLWTGMALGLNNFRRTRDYYPGVFQDVPSGVWYESGVQTLYERGLTEGGRRFGPQSRVTLGETVSLAVSLHRIYNGWAMPEGMSGLQYALNTGIVTADQYDDYAAPATRRSFAAIMAKALPSEALRGINIVMDGAIPDVPMSDPGAQGIYRLYRAGVLVGGDTWGTFRPDSLITRDTASVIVSRMVEPALRKGTSLMNRESYQVYLDRSALLLSPGQTDRLTAVVYPVNNLQAQTVAWTSSETRTAVVDQYGTVTALRPGTALIIASTPSGTMATCTVRVVDWY
ncbi:MAG: hypothetical protein HFF98_08115 [Oscillibacter sp.]|jgi:hypothetical protein|nr:hypothetical protein [Oscillibacter sp.]